MCPSSHKSLRGLRPGAARHNCRRSTPGMNKLESSFAAYLEKRRLAGEVLDYRYESLRLRLAPKTFYTPDFFVALPAEFQVYEVKGHWEDDARVKIKWAAQLYWYFRFFGVRQEKREGWVFEEFGL